MSFAFINIYSTKEEALSVRYSPNTNIYSFKGIHLLPNNTVKYVQTSFTAEGIELEDWEVFAVSLCGNNRVNITENFHIERVFQDNSGTSQIDWSIDQLPDMGTGLVYLEINQLLEPGDYSQTWYTNVFQITDYGAENTALVHYRDDVLDTMQSIQLNLYWCYDKKSFEFASYKEVSTRLTKTVTASSSKYQIWQTGIIPRDLIIKITDLFDLTYMYVDYVRCFPFEPVDIPDPEASENYAEYTFSLSFSFNDVYDPTVSPIVPVPDPEQTQFIDFTRLLQQRGLNVYLYWSYTGFVPENGNFDYQISTNNVDFTSVLISPPLLSNASTNLKIIALPAYNTIYFVRIVANGTIISNTLNIEING